MQSFKSDAQLWIDQNREYPLLCERDESQQLPVTPEPAPPAAAACFSCRANPAGFGDWYVYSAYCAACQPLPDFGELAPYGMSRSRWLPRLESNLAEIHAARMALEGLQT